MSNNIALVDPIAGGLSGKIPLPTGTDKAYMFLNGEGEFVPVDSEDTRFNTDKCKSIVIFTGEVGDYLSGDGTFQPTSSIQLKNLGDTSLSSDLTTGAILNYNGSSWANLNPGTDGYTLVSDSANANKIIWQTSSKYVNVGSQSTNTTISLTGVSGTSNHILSKSNAKITSAGLLSAVSFSASTNIITNKFTGSAIRFSSLSANGVLINNASGVVTNKSYTSTNKNSVLMINNAGSAVDWLPTSSIHDNRITISGGNSITLKTGSTGHDNYFLNEQGEYVQVTSESGVDKLRDLTDVTINTTSIQKGALLYYNDTTNKKWGTLNPGTDGYVLTPDSNNTDKLIWQTASRYVSVRQDMPTTSTSSLVGVYYNGSGNFELTKSAATITSGGKLTLTDISASSTISASRCRVTSQYFYLPSITSTSASTGVLLRQSNGKIVRKDIATGDNNKLLSINSTGDGFDWVSTSSIKLDVQNSSTDVLLTGINSSETGNKSFYNTPVTVSSVGDIAAKSLRLSDFKTTQYSGGVAMFLPSSGDLSIKSYTLSDKNKVLGVSNSGNTLEWISTSSFHDNRITISRSSTQDDSFILQKNGSSDMFLSADGTYQTISVSGGGGSGSTDSRITIIGRNYITLSNKSSGNSNKFLNELGQYIEPTVSSTDSRIAINGSTPITLSNQSTGNSNKFLNEKGQYTYPETNVIKVNSASISLVAGNVYIFSKTFMGGAGMSTQAILPEEYSGKITLLFHFIPGDSEYYTVYLKTFDDSATLFDIGDYNTVGWGRPNYTYSLHIESYGIHTLYGGGDGWYGDLANRIY